MLPQRASHERNRANHQATSHAGEYSEHKRCDIQIRRHGVHFLESFSGRRIHGAAARFPSRIDHETRANRISYFCGFAAGIGGGAVTVSVSGSIFQVSPMRFCAEASAC